MRLHWHPQDPDPRPLISSSLTPREATKLREVAPNKVVVEVGAALGFSTVVMAKVAARVWSIDPHSSELAEGGTLETFRTNLRAYDVAHKVTEVVKESSVGLPWLLRLIGRQAGLVFIDGSHLYKDVLDDLNGGSRLLEPGGVMAVHDYREETCPGVEMAVNDWLRGRRTAPSVELVDTLAVIQL